MCTNIKSQNSVFVEFAICCNIFLLFQQLAKNCYGKQCTVFLNQLLIGSSGFKHLTCLFDMGKLFSLLVQKLRIRILASQPSILVLSIRDTNLKCNSHLVWAYRTRAIITRGLYIFYPIFQSGL